MLERLWSWSINDSTNLLIFFFLMCWLLSWLLGNNVKMTEVVFVSQGVQPNGGDRHELSRSVYEHVRINWDKCSKERECGPWELVTKQSDTWRRWLWQWVGVKASEEGIRWKSLWDRGNITEAKGSIQGVKENPCARSSECQRREWCLPWGRRHRPESPCRELRAVEGFKVGVQGQICSWGRSGRPVSKGCWGSDGLREACELQRWKRGRSGWTGVRRSRRRLVQTGCERVGM